VKVGVSAGAGKNWIEDQATDDPDEGLFSEYCTPSDCDT
jgi:hypothetical protein